LKKKKKKHTTPLTRRSIASHLFFSSASFFRKNLGDVTRKIVGARNLKKKKEVRHERAMNVVTRRLTQASIKERIDQHLYVHHAAAFSRVYEECSTWLATEGRKLLAAARPATAATAQGTSTAVIVALSRHANKRRKCGEDDGAASATPILVYKRKKSRAWSQHASPPCSWPRHSALQSMPQYHAFSNSNPHACHRCQQRSERTLSLYKLDCRQSPPNPLPQCP
jgi:hypothetical protein